MRRRVGLLVGVLGAALAAHGFWIPAKAALAQHLLERAWERTLRGEEAARPWPWADHWPVARLRVPRLGASVVVLEGATGGSLAFAPGHLAGSAHPGAPGNAVLAAHRDTHFAFLRELRVGDAVEVERSDGGSVRYTVEAVRVAHERDTTWLEDAPGRVLTLVTCWPFTARAPGGPWRYVVRAAAGEAAASAGGAAPAGRRNARSTGGHARLGSPS